MVAPMCHDYHDWVALREEALDPEPAEPTYEADPKSIEKSDPEGPVPIADD